ncbi:hypothetical protein AX17_007103 [Amanita inopinata Kibby_2008]|nr:hypothetical protein AX17_007103 [Amanita inopinata Kibby_2008]
MVTILEKLKRRLVASPLMTSEPLRLFVLSIFVGWEDVMKVAALNTLSRPLQDVVNIGYLEWITAVDLFQLVKYRFKCAGVACKVVNSSNLPDASGSDCIGYSRCRRSYYPMHENEAVNIVRDLRACPRGATLAGSYAALFKRLRGMDDDALTYIKLIECLNTTIDQIEEAVSKVSIDIEMKGVGA